MTDPSETAEDARHRFTLDGVAWDGRAWVLAPALAVLARQLEAVDPEPHTYDRTVEAMASGTDHAVTDGVVLALDVGGNPGALDELLERLRSSKDARIRVAIHHRRMVLSTAAGPIDAWRYRPHYGAGRHAARLHISVVAELAADETEWKISNPRKGRRRSR